MSLWEIKVNKTSSKYLKKLENKKKENLLLHIKELKNWIENRELTFPLDIKTLKGQWEGKYRIRAGDVRIIFQIDPGEKLIRILYIGPRGDVYR